MNRYYNRFCLKSFLFFTFYFLLSFSSSGQSNWNTIKNSGTEKELITLIISHDDCSTCLDAQVYKGSIPWPDSLIRKNMQLPELPTIVFNNKTLSALLFGKHGSLHFNYTYMIMAKIIRYYNSPKAGTYVPVIEVYQYRFLKEKEIQQ
ncbi:MAG: hypothetical protein ABJA78_11815 [Ferruginibacter sp.]